MKSFVLVLCIARALAAQTTLEIHGTVIEPGLGGIAGAEVRTLMLGTAGVQATPLSAFTDGRGQFVIRTGKPGYYPMSAQLGGYAPAGRYDRIVATVDLDHPRADVQIRLVRTGVVMGRLLDAETREPIEGVQIFVMQKQFDGREIAWSQASTIPPSFEVTPENSKTVFQKMDEERRTKKDGTFTISGVMPGEVAATVTPLAASPWTAGFSASDLKVIDQDYEPLFWPGGVSRDSVHPLTLGSGSVASFGDMLLTKTPHYRAHVSIAQGTCPMGESMRVTLFGGGSPAAMQVAPCGSEWTLRHLRPGSYVLYAVSDWQAYRDSIEDAAWATLRFEISDENVEITLDPQRGVMIEGRLMAADGVTTIPDEIAMGAQPELAPDLRPGLEGFVEWLPDRRFRMMVSPRPFNMEALPGGAVFVKQLRYNGSPLPDSKVPLNPGASAHNLEIVLDDKFGGLVGTVTGGSLQSMVVLWKEGAARPEQIPIPVENGSFRTNRLIPGEYRAVVVTRDGLGFAMPSAAEAQKGEKVTIHAGETTTINIRATGASK